MKSILKIVVILFFLSSIRVVAQAPVLFQLSFEDPEKTPEASGSKLVESLMTEYGEIKYLDISFHNGSKTYHQVEIFGWVEFRSGSDVISNSSSYLELPPISFADGGNFFINYGAGQTGRRMRLQEWNGTAWDNASYPQIEALASSTWYQQNWIITGSGTKRFRLVMTSSPPMNVTSIVVTGNACSLNHTSGDTLKFGSANINANETVVRSFQVIGTNLSSNILVGSSSSVYKSSTTANGPFYSSIQLPPQGGSVYVKYAPAAVSHDLSTLTMSCYGVSNKTIVLEGSGIYLSNEKKINSFVLDNYTGVIDEATKKIEVSVPSSFNLFIPYSPLVTVSDNANLLTSSEVVFQSGVPVIYTVQAEDGSLCNYEVTVTKLSGENKIHSFVINGYEGLIDESLKVITVKVPSSFDFTLSYTPLVAISEKATLLNSNPVLFTSGLPVIFTVQAEDGSLSDYQVLVNQLSGENRITSFIFNGISGDIDDGDDNVYDDQTIEVTVPSTTNLSLPYTPLVTVSEKATLLTSGPIYFSSGVPVPFTVQAEDGSLYTYQVIVKLTVENKLIYNDSIHVFSVNDRIVITSPNLVNYCIFSTNGTLIDMNTSDNSGLCSYKNGVYIVLVNGNSYKVLVK